MLQNKACCVVGCDIKNLPFNDEYSMEFSEYDNRIQDILETLYDYGYTKFFVCLNSWVEIWAAENIIRMSQSCPAIELHIMVASCSKFKESNDATFQARSEHIQFCTHYVEDISNLISEESRSKWMVQKSDLLFVIGNPRKDINLNSLLEIANFQHCLVYVLDPQKYKQADRKDLLDLHKDNFDEIPKPFKAILKKSYKAEGEDDDGVKIQILLDYGEIVECWDNRDGTYTVYNDSGATLEVPEKNFLSLFRTIDNNS